MFSVAKLLCIDFEASGLGPSSFPIELALADCASGEVQSWLIRPADRWLASGIWEPQAESIHGISRAMLEKDGLTVAEITAVFTRRVRGHAVLSDSTLYDGKWLGDLYGIESKDPPCALEDLHRFTLRAGNGSVDIVDAAWAEARRRYPKIHRAAPDARRNAETLRILAGLA